MIRTKEWPKGVESIKHEDTIPPFVGLIKSMYDLKEKETPPEYDGLSIGPSQRATVQTVDDTLSKANLHRWREVGADAKLHLALTLAFQMGLEHGRRLEVCRPYYVKEREAYLNSKGPK